MTKTARSLKISKNPRGLNIAYAYPNLNETQQRMRYEMLLKSKSKKERTEINQMFDQINKDQGGVVDKNTSTPQDPLWGPKKRETPLW